MPPLMKTQALPAPQATLQKAIAAAMGLTSLDPSISAVLPEHLEVEVRKVEETRTGEGSGDENNGEEQTVGNNGGLSSSGESSSSGIGEEGEEEPQEIGNNGGLSSSA